MTEDHIAEAERGLRKLFPNHELKGASFLDVGCGSGLSMLAALRLGAAEVRGIDPDYRCLSATRYLLSKFAAKSRWNLEAKSILDFSEPHDVTYCWGVLHHTGAMWRTLDHLCGIVPANGLLAISLYAKTPVCSFWEGEKRFYSSAGKRTQGLMRLAYKTAYLAGVTASGKNPVAYVRNVRSARGMSFHHDVHDWLGGYPYESATPEEVSAALTKAGLTIERSFARPVAAKGLFGSHCDEYVARRIKS